MKSSKKGGQLVRVPRQTREVWPTRKRIDEDVEGADVSRTVYAFAAGVPCTASYREVVVDLSEPHDINDCAPVYRLTLAHSRGNSGPNVHFDVSFRQKTDPEPDYEPEAITMLDAWELRALATSLPVAVDRAIADGILPADFWTREVGNA